MYSCVISWWWAMSRPKHVETNFKWNIYLIVASSWCSHLSKSKCVNHALSASVVTLGNTAVEIQMIILTSFSTLYFVRRHFTCFLYRGADKSLARPDWKNNWNVAIFCPTRRSLLSAETWLDGQLSELFLSGLQKLEFGRCSFFSFLVGLRTYQHPGTDTHVKMVEFWRTV
jgi:hypothetical protein